MKDIKNSFNLITFGSIVLDIILIIMGIFMITNKTIGPESALVVFGVMLLISGVYAIIKYLIHPKNIFKFELIYGVLSIIAAAFAIFKPFEVANFITIIVGIWLIVTSVFKFFISVELKNYNQDSWIFDLSISALTILLGIMLLINPFNGYMVLSTYVGIMLTIYCAMDMTEQFLIRKRVNSIVEFLKSK